MRNKIAKYKKKITNMNIPVYGRENCNRDLVVCTVGELAQLVERDGLFVVDHDEGIYIILRK